MACSFYFIMLKLKRQRAFEIGFFSSKLEAAVITLIINPTVLSVSL
jgi:hypothetical protein